MNNRKNINSGEKTMHGTFANSQYIGKIVEVKIDRQLGSRHPDFGYVYPVNYGFIPETTAEDGEELDAYVLGINEATTSYIGFVTAMIHRLNENDDKLVVVPDGYILTDEQIRELTMFQEKYFESMILREPLV